MAGRDEHMMDKYLAELVETHGLTDVLGGLVKYYGNQAALAAENEPNAPDTIKMQAMARMLTHCWQFVGEFAAQKPNPYKRVTP